MQNALRALLGTLTWSFWFLRTTILSHLCHIHLPSSVFVELLLYEGKPCGLLLKIFHGLQRTTRAPFLINFCCGAQKFLTNLSGFLQTLQTWDLIQQFLLLVAQEKK